jgi:hypothetical protein
MFSIVPGAIRLHLGIAFVQVCYFYLFTHPK